MALIKCDECGKDVSDKAKKCPHCGNPINEDLQIQFDLEKEKIGLSFFRELLFKRAQSVSVVASLSATVLVVATFNEALIPLTNGVRIALTVLLLIIPASTLTTILENTIALNKQIKSYKKKLGKDFPTPATWYGKLLTYWVHYSPIALALVLTMVIGYVIYALWCL